MNTCRPTNTRSPTAAVVAGILSVAIAARADALMTSQEGNAPLSPANYTEWPGLVEVVNDESRVYQVWVNGNEQAFYRGDTSALARVLAAFVKAGLGEHVVVLRPGPGERTKRDGKTERYDWTLSMISGIAGSFLDEPDADLVWDRHPTLTVFTGGGVDLGALRVPREVTLIGVDELRERYARGLRSSTERVRGYAAALLAEADPYGAETESAIASLLDDDATRSFAERALAILEERRKDPQDVRTRHRAQIQRIRDYVFSWRYPWLEPGVAMTMVIAAVFLAVTLVAARARRRRSRRALEEHAPARTPAAP